MPKTLLRNSPMSFENDKTFCIYKNLNNHTKDKSITYANTTQLFRNQRQPGGDIRDIKRNDKVGHRELITNQITNKIFLKHARFK